MESLDKILFDSSKKTILEATKFSLKNEVLFRDMMNYAFAGKGIYSARAMRVICECGDASPEKVTPCLSYLINKLKTLKEDAIIRGILKCVMDLGMPEDLDSRGILLNACFNYLGSAGESVAVKYYSMEILFRLSGEYRDIKQELIDLLEVVVLSGSSALKYNGNRILKKLYLDI